nr:unnamed protein product [Callosobruchus chinensis]
MVHPDNLDVINAFNTARWELILEELKERGIRLFIVYVLQLEMATLATLENVKNVIFLYLRQLARPSSPTKDSISLVSHYNPFAISRKASLTYQIPYRNSYVNRSKTAHTYATHPERVTQIIKSKDAHVLCSYFTSKKYVDKVEQLIEQRKSLLDSKHEGAKITYEHVIDCAQPGRKKIKHQQERSLEDEVEEEDIKPQSLVHRIADCGKRKPTKTTVMSLMLRKKYEDSKKFPILDPATPELMANKRAKITYEHVIDCAQPGRKKIKHQQERSLEDEVEEEDIKPQSLVHRIADCGKRKPTKTTVMSLMLRKKYEDSKKFPILDPATPELMANKSAVLRHRTTILPLILKSTKRAKQKDEDYSDRDIDHMDMQNSDVRSIKEREKYAEEPRMAIATASSERQSKTLDRLERRSSRRAGLSRNMTTVSVPLERLESSRKNIRQGAKSTSSSLEHKSPIKSNPASKEADDGESHKSFWSILNWTPFGYGAKQVNRPTPSIYVNRVFKNDKVDTPIHRDGESMKKAVFKNSKSTETDATDANVYCAKGTAMSKTNKRKSRTKDKKLGPPPGIKTKFFLSNSDVDNIDNLYQKVRTASATRPMEPVEDKKYSTRSECDYLVTKDHSPTYKLVTALQKRRMKYRLNRFKLAPGNLKQNSIKFINKPSTGVAAEVLPESDSYSLFVGKARYKLAYTGSTIVLVTSIVKEDRKGRKE